MHMSCYHSPTVLSSPTEERSEAAVLAVPAVQPWRHVGSTATCKAGSLLQGQEMFVLAPQTHPEHSQAPQGLTSQSSPTKVSPSAPCKLSPGKHNP